MTNKLKNGMVYLMKVNNSFHFTWDDITSNPKHVKRFVSEFKSNLEALGEMLIGKVSPKRILDIFIQQGYWSGVAYNIYFDFTNGWTYSKRLF